MLSTQGPSRVFDNLFFQKYGFEIEMLEKKPLFVNKLSIWVVQIEKVNPVADRIKLFSFANKEFLYFLLLI